MARVGEVQSGLIRITDILGRIADHKITRAWTYKRVAKCGPLNKGCATDRGKG